MKILRAAVIGCGRIAYSFDDDPKRKIISTHIGAYQHTPGVELIAVCDSKSQRVKEVCGKHKTLGYNDYIKMLSEQNIDIVSVCTPSETHKDIVQNIARRKLVKAIFCEKPIAETLKQAHAMIDVCQKNKIVLQINHQRRFDEMHQGIRHKIKNNTWGKVQQVNFSYCSGIKNSGSHMFDLLRSFFGDVIWVKAYHSSNPSNNPNDPNLDGFIYFKSGLLGTFKAFDNAAYYIFDLDIRLEMARLVIKEAGFDVDFYTLGESKFFSNCKVLVNAPAPFPIKYASSYMIRGIEALMDCLQNGKENISSGEEGLKSMELIELSIKSAALNGRRMFIKETKRVK